MPKTIISSKPDTLRQFLTKIYVHRNLLLVFAKRDLKIKYAQTMLGLAWTILQPLTAVAVFTLFFSVLMDFKTDYPFVLYVLSGIAVWNLFNYIFMQGGTALINNPDLIRKLNFPKVLLPVAKALTGLTEFGITFLILIVLHFALFAIFKWQAILSILVIFLVVLLALGMAFIMCATTVRYRDLHHILPFLVQFGIWFTPVFYPVSLLPNEWSHFIYLNPMAALVQLFRCCFFPEDFHPWMLLGVPVSLIIFILGFFWMKKVDNKVVEMI